MSMSELGDDFFSQISTNNKLSSKNVGYYESGSKRPQPGSKLSSLMVSLEEDDGVSIGAHLRSSHSKTRAGTFKPVI